MKNNRIYEYDCIRFLAILSVVIGHSCYMSIGYTHYPLPDNVDPIYKSLIFENLRWLARFIYSFHMPLFFILSGAVFGLSVFDNGVKRSIDFSRIIDKKIWRLILPYCFYGALFMIPIKFMMGWYPPSSNVGKEIFYFLIYGTHSGHLWFLFSLFSVFVVATILVSYFKLNSIYSIFGMFLTGIALTWIFGSGKPSNTPHAFEIYNIFSELYLMCFILGLVFAYYLPSINLAITRYKALTLSLITFAIHAVSWNFLSSYPYNAIICSYYATLVFLSLYFLFRYFCSFPFVIQKLNSRVSTFFFTNLMGIYLLHDPLNYVILKVASIYQWLESPLGVCFYYFSRTIGLFLLCSVLSQIINNLVKSGKQFIAPKTP